MIRWRNIKNQLRQAVLHSALLLPLLAMPPAAAEETAPIPLPEQGVRMQHADREGVQVVYDSGSRKLRFINISSRDHTPATACRAELAGADGAQELPIENLQWQTAGTPVDWLVIIDESDSMRLTSGAKNKRVYLREAAILAQVLVGNMRPADTIQVKLLSSAFSPLGEKARGDNDNEKTALIGELNALAENAHKRKNEQTAWTALFHLLELELTDRVRDGLPTDRNLAIVLLTDGDDDTSPEDSRSSLISLSNKHNVHISAAVFYHKAKKTKVNSFEALCAKTNGLFVGIGAHPTEAELKAFFSGINRLEHRDSGDLTIVLPENLGEAGELSLTLLGENNSQLCNLTLSRQALDAIISHFTPKPPPSPGECDRALTGLLNGIREAEPRAAELAAAEAATPSIVDDVRAASTKLKLAAEEIRPFCITLKKSPAADLEKALAAAAAAPTDDEKVAERIKRIKDFCGDTSINAENIEQKHLLALVGRTTPLPFEDSAPQPAPPAPPAEAPEKAIEPWMYWAGAAGIFVLLAVASVLYVIFRNKDEEEEDFPPLPPDPPSGPISPPVPTPTPTPVPAPKPVLAVLTNLTTGARYRIVEKQTTIGRGATNNIIIDHKTVSSSHCVLKLHRDKEKKVSSWLLVDLHSANGIYAGKKLHRELRLSDNTTFELGEIKFKFNLAKNN